MPKVNRIHAARSHISDISGYHVQGKHCAESWKGRWRSIITRFFPLLSRFFKFFEIVKKIFYNFRPKFIEKFRKKLTNVFQYFLQNCTSEDWKNFSVFQNFNIFKKKSKFQKKNPIFQFLKNFIFFSKFSIFSNFEFFQNFHVFWKISCFEKFYFFFEIFDFFYIFHFWLQKFSVSIDFGADVDFIFNMISDILRLKLCYQYILKYVAYFVSSDLM